MNGAAGATRVAHRNPEASPDTGLLPLVVDLDGTLTPADTLLESVVRVLRRNPLDALRLPLWVLKGRAAFKQEIASRADFSAEQLPYRASLVGFLRSEKQRGRRLVLATASDREVAHAVAAHLGLFDDVLASDGCRNLKGAEKLRAIREKVGERYVYAGDSTADLPVWKAAHAAIPVGVTSGLAQSIRKATVIEREFPREEIGAAGWLRALRVHQWLKNLLIFVPLLTAFSFLDYAKLGTAVVAFFAFCFAASASYIVNDVWDIESDRAHPRKRRRAFASAQIPITLGLAVAAGALALALMLAAAVSQAFLLMALLYLALTGLYSWVLKQHALVDVIALSLLYTLRILAGSVAVGVTTSSWLLAFSVFIFFSLALVKRCTELASLGQAGAKATPGRDYLVSDLVVLWPLGVVSALCAVVVFGLFISDPETVSRYDSPRLLWLVAIGLIYWLSRIWIKCARGQMDDDPVVFAIRDPGSRITVLGMIIATLAARFVALGSF